MFHIICTYGFEIIKNKQSKIPYEGFNYTNIL